MRYKTVSLRKTNVGSALLVLHWIARTDWAPNRGAGLRADSGQSGWAFDFGVEGRMVRLETRQVRGRVREHIRVDGIY
jgi:hypothetical protein